MSSVELPDQLRRDVLSTGNNDGSVPDRIATSDITWMQGRTFGNRMPARLTRQGQLDRSSTMISRPIIKEGNSATSEPRRPFVNDPYGGVTVLNADWSASSAPMFEFGFQGGAYDSTSGLYNFRNWDYSTSLGRWMQRDPLGYVDGMSLYEFVVSNPVGATDPLGMATTQPATTEAKVFWMERWIMERFSKQSWEGIFPAGRDDVAYDMYKFNVFIKAHTECGEVVFDPPAPWSGSEQIESRGPLRAVLKGYDVLSDPITMRVNGRKVQRFVWTIGAASGDVRWVEELFEFASEGAGAIATKGRGKPIMTGGAIIGKKVGSWIGKKLVGKLGASAAWAIDVYAGDKGVEYSVEKLYQRTYGSDDLSWEGSSLYGHNPDYKK